MEEPENESRLRCKNCGAEIPEDNDGYCSQACHDETEFYEAGEY